MGAEVGYVVVGAVAEAGGVVAGCCGLRGYIVVWEEGDALEESFEEHGDGGVVSEMES